MTYGQTVAHEIATRASGSKQETNQIPQQDQKKQGIQYKQQLLKTVGVPQQQ